ncbi:LVIVD repeat-containing protein [Rhodohalobacter sp. 8-1]|uniref:LVIVD repeat-containing protein n=1 Tax=Rhodohalobacter sp. 8-1 TaxID=3131972 RepID=UPI0030EE7FE5
MNSITKKDAGSGRLRIPRFSVILTLFATFLMGFYACSTTDQVQAPQEELLTPIHEIPAPSEDPRVGLAAGLFDAEEAIWNMNLLSNTPPPSDFVGSTNSDLAFYEHYAIQGNYNGFIIWDISDPANPDVVIDFLCPASQSDVSVYENLLFVSGEGLGGRLDCGTEGVESAVSDERLRGIRIFDISNIQEPEYLANVQTCRGSHTHSVLKDPDDDENIYIYVSGSATVRPEEELPGCTSAFPDEDPDSPLFRIEVIQVPLDDPASAAIANSPRIFENLEAPPTREMTEEQRQELEAARERGAFIGMYRGEERIIRGYMIRDFLQQIVEERGGSGQPTAADSTELRERLTEFIDARLARGGESSQALGPNQCHDITLYPDIGRAGGACEGYGLLLDISDPLNPVRIDAVADSNFAYWHSATFNNDGSTVLFTDEWGGGGQPKCRAEDPMEWGANAIYSINSNNEMRFESYYKMPAPQTAQENCVAHNGSLIPIPGRDIMVQSWYQGGVSVFDYTDPKNPIEIAFHDRGPISADQMASGGSWSIYWYNGVLVNSEISRGLDIFQLSPSPYLTENEIAASRTVELNQFNPQGQVQFNWPASYALAHAYLDQMSRNRDMTAAEISAARRSLHEAEQRSGSRKGAVLRSLAEKIESQASGSSEKVTKFTETVRNLASM